MVSEIPVPLPRSSVILEIRGNRTRCQYHGPAQPARAGEETPGTGLVTRLEREFT